MGVPIFLGAFVSVLDVFMMGFSDFDFVVKYYFTVFMLCIGIAFWNGLILQLCILHCFETAFVKTEDISKQMSEKAILKTVQTFRRFSVVALRQNRTAAS